MCFFILFLIIYCSNILIYIQYIVHILHIISILYIVHILLYILLCVYILFSYCRYYYYWFYSRSFFVIGWHQHAAMRTYCMWLLLALWSGLHAGGGGGVQALVEYTWTHGGAAVPESRDQGGRGRQGGVASPERGHVGRHAQRDERRHAQRSEGKRRTTLRWSRSVCRDSIWRDLRLHWQQPMRFESLKFVKLFIFKYWYNMTHNQIMFILHIYDQIGFGWASATSLRKCLFCIAIKQSMLDYPLVLFWRGLSELCIPSSFDFCFSLIVMFDIFSPVRQRADSWAWSSPCCGTTTLVWTWRTPVRTTPQKPLLNPARLHSQSLILAAISILTVWWLEVRRKGFESFWVLTSGVLEQDALITYL